MTDKIPQFYKQAIYHSFRGVIDIHYPTKCGQQNNLVFVKTNASDYVVKFNPCEMVQKNQRISQMASNKGIPFPDVHLGKYHDTLFEYYTMIPGQTLAQQIQRGMPKQAVRRAFSDILTQFVYMKNLSVDNLSVNKCIKAHEVNFAHAKKCRKPAVAQLMRAAIYLLNHGSKQNIGLYHCDITPNNVLVDDKGQLISFIDIDSVSICNRNFAFCIIANEWAKLGFNPDELYDQYEYLSDQPINRAYLNTVRNIMWAGCHLISSHEK